MGNFEWEKGRLRTYPAVDIPKALKQLSRGQHRYDAHASWSVLDGVHIDVYD